VRTKAPERRKRKNHSTCTQKAQGIIGNSANLVFKNAIRKTKVKRGGKPSRGAY